MDQGLEADLDTPLFHLLDEVGIRSKLGWAGFIGNYHTLSAVAILGREIIRVDDPGLHFTWKSQPPTHFIKPLPSLVVQTGLPFHKLKQKTKGLLYSYPRLIHSELDFMIATEKQLLPRSLHTQEGGGWETWLELYKQLRGGTNLHRKQSKSKRHYDSWSMLKSISKEIKTECTDCTQYRERLDNEREIIEQEDRVTRGQCHRRYQSGDLNLTITSVLSGLNGYGWYSWPTTSLIDRIFEGNKRLIATFIIYTGLVLTAMQVSLQATSEPEWVKRSFRYSRYPIVLIFAAQVRLILIGLCLFAVTALFNVRGYKKAQDTRSLAVGVLRKRGYWLNEGISELLEMLQGFQADAKTPLRNLFGAGSG